MSASSDKIKFWVLLNNQIVRVSASREETLVDFFINLRNNSEAAHHIPSWLGSDACVFYQLRDPVSISKGGNRSPNDEFRNKILRACWKESNKEPLDPVTTVVGELVEEFFAHNIYLVIHYPSSLGDSDMAVFTLRTNHSLLFSCLGLTVKKWRQWTRADMKTNLDGGDILEDDNGDFKDVLEVLGEERVYDTNADWGRDLENALSYKMEFDGAFTPARNGPYTVASGREFVAFYNVLRCFKDDVGRIKHNTSSALKASNFTVHFIQPPFFSDVNSSSYEYHQEKSWEFPIFINTNSAPGVYRRFVPKSDCMVISQSKSKIPFIISEVISQVSESDRYRMLVQAIALARTGQYLLKSTEKRFLVVAVYIDKDMVASRYLVRQTDPNGRKVFILKNNFDLAKPAEQIKFLREMYNLTKLIKELSGNLDAKKEVSLSSIKDDAKDIVSL